MNIPFETGMDTVVLPTNQPVPSIGVFYRAQVLPTITLLFSDRKLKLRNQMESKQADRLAITRIRPNRLVMTLSGLFIPLLLASCSFDAPGSGIICELKRRAVLKNGSSVQQTTVFESPGTLIAYHGSACAESNKSGQEDVIAVEQSIALPAYATHATVFLNGWDLNYLNSDHQVGGLGTIITNIRVEGNTLKWRAVGTISDKNFDDGYRWCYHYTVIAWNPATINLIVDHTDGDCNATHATGNYYTTSNDNTTTALSSFPSFLMNKEFSSYKVVSILPRGFGFYWGGQSVGLSYIDDYNLLQMAYAIGHPEVFVQSGKYYKKQQSDIAPLLASVPSQVGNGYVSWETSTIFKDNKNRRDYGFGEMVSGLSGADLGVIDPPFSVLPITNNGQGSESSAAVERKTFVIDNIPYKHAIPVLTGWDLGYLTSDQQVSGVGIWIETFSYDKNPAQLTGRLTYTVSSALHDKDSSPGFYARPKVTIVGFQATTGKETPPRK